MTDAHDHPTTEAHPVAHKLTSAAQRLDMSRRTLERFVATGRVRVVRLGRTVRVPESEIQRLLRGE